MLAVHNGQCGLCSHFGEGHASNDKLVAILTTKQAPESMVDSCGLPKNASLHLKVTPISGCDGFEPAHAA
ncbi:hypothetical protein [Paracidobacterium acidisoli]|uniref:Uncharacterized protein n=1 Tax=Paracidobacterium acidisoli TaxID=2303751 RepID=A0A372INJ5_9BACT|nr:hypothetical protein [Paracidobacterium acidisoli]MBT9331776.1 hypothetical protein [Paracidobacterium acidisoli]